VAAGLTKQGKQPDAVVMDRTARAAAAVLLQIMDLQVDAAGMVVVVFVLLLQ
jgi:hypothetical protein